MYKEVDITVVESSNVHHLHKHHFFELIYVIEGSGIHMINNNKYIFSKGNVFFLTPDDLHSFKIIDTCKLCIVDFTANLFSNKSGKRGEKMDLSDFFKRLEYVFHNHHNAHGDLVNQIDKPIFEALINKLIEEDSINGIYKEVIIQNIVFLLLNLLARSIHNSASGHSVLPDKKGIIHDIIVYIQQHIYDKELIMIKNLASVFNKSKDYLCRYFKSQTGNTLKDYILQYKLELILTRLKFSELTISEIAYEMNFTDESHLNKTFKKQYGMTAKQYRLSLKGTITRN